MLYAIFNCVFTVSLVFWFMEQTYYYQTHSLLFVTPKAANKIIIKRGREKIDGSLIFLTTQMFPALSGLGFLIPGSASQ